MFFGRGVWAMFLAFISKSTSDQRKIEQLDFIRMQCFFFFFFERQCERGRERGVRRRILSRLCTVSADPNVGLEFLNCEIMT